MSVLGKVGETIHATIKKIMSESKPHSWSEMKEMVLPISWLNYNDISRQYSHINIES